MSSSESGQYPPHDHPRFGPCDASCGPYREQKRQEERAPCRECGQPFRPEEPVVGGLDQILYVPCIGAALSRVTD